MTFEEYIQKIPAKLSKVKLLILKALWESGKNFPRSWVESSALLQITGQKYFDRRVRELKDELGCDVEIGFNNGKPSYRLLSEKLRSPNPRKYLTESQKKVLFEESNYSCQICGKKFSKGEKGLQADHKVPLIRVGGHDRGNWQPLCTECNVGKRRACEKCGLECVSCSWAFPEKMGTLVLMRIPTDLRKKLAAKGIGDNQSIEKYLLRLLGEA